MPITCKENYEALALTGDARAAWWKQVDHLIRVGAYTAVMAMLSAHILDVDFGHQVSIIGESITRYGETE